MISGQRQEQIPPAPLSERGVGGILKELFLIPAAQVECQLIEAVHFTKPVTAAVLFPVLFGNEIEWWDSFSVN